MGRRGVSRGEPGLGVRGAEESMAWLDSDVLASSCAGVCRVTGSAMEAQGWQRTR